MPAPRAGFKKFRDDKVKKSPKRLQHRPKQARHQFKNGKKDQTYIQKLLSSIKRRMLHGPQNKKANNIKRKLDFKERRQQSSLPKPKFYRPQAANKAQLNETIEEGEIVDTTQAADLTMISDDDDCVLVEPTLTNITVNDSLDESKPSMSLERRLTANLLYKDKPRSPGQNRGLNANIMYKDVNRKPGLLRSPHTSNGLLYSTVAANFKSQPIKDAIVVIEDSFDSIPTSSKQQLDNSVIFVSEQKLDEDFIPLPVDEEAKQQRKRKIVDPVKDKTTPKRRKSDNLFTSTEKRQLTAYNSNTYNPTAGEDRPAGNKRPIIIDGSNVAFCHACSNGFSAEGVKYCLDYFIKMGHDVKAVMPMFRRNRDKSSNPELLDQLHREGKVVFTPCKNLPGQMSTSYDDRFILQLAYEQDAAVVSNDNYRDLIHENPAFKKIIENRVIGYTWCNNIFLLPKDPYGRWGPTLDQILHY